MNQLEPYRSQGPPVEQGETLLSLERNNGRERLRVSGETYNDHPFIRLQVWEVNGQGEWWPVRGKCVTVKIRECAELSQMLAAVARQHESARPAGPDRGRGTDRGPVGEGNYLGRRRDAPQSRGSSRWGGAPQRSLPGPTRPEPVVHDGQLPDPPFEPTRPARPFTEFADE